MLLIKASAIATAIVLTLLQAFLIQGAYIPEASDASHDSSFTNDSSTTRLVVKRDITPIERQRLDDLKDSYKGIWWDEAYPGAGLDEDNGECTMDQFNILAEATRIAISLAEYQEPDLLREDSPSHRFFVRNSRAPPGGRWTSNDQFIHAYGNMHRTNGCRAGGPAAYTVPAQTTGFGWATIFCPLFFQGGRYLNAIAAGPRKTINDFGAPNLVSYEQMIVHEWMHADVMGYSQHIEDVFDSLDPNTGPPVKIYGMSRCRDYAWKYMRDPCCGHVNPTTIANADNYAWYFANKYYARLWGWTDDGSALGSYDFGVASPTIDNPDNYTSVASLPELTWPANCVADPSPIVPDSVNITINCDLGPPAPDVPVAPPQAPGTCVCNEDGCTPESPACCGDGSC